jgi:hypothetical protein
MSWHELQFVQFENVIAAYGNFHDAEWGYVNVASSSDTKVLSHAEPGSDVSAVESCVCFQSRLRVAVVLLCDKGERKG